MSLTILNNISDLTAENSLSMTQMNLQKTLTQLSTGMKINSGSDDAAGLSIANGMTANMAALTQSQQNANNGVGLLQTADGALSQVTTLLNRAVTLATEASSSGLTTGTNSQAAALNNEFQSILTEIDQIGNTTNFNGENVFSSNSPTSFLSTQASLTATTALTTGSTTTISDSATGGTFVFTAKAGDTVTDLENAVAGAVSAGTLSAGTTASLNGTGQLIVGPNTGDTGIQVSSNDAVLGAMEAVPGTSDNNTVFISDGTTSGAANTTITTTINSLSAAFLGLSGMDLNSTTDAQSALTAVNSAINLVSAQRGEIGASVNRLQAASTVMNTQVQNLQSATNSIQNADIGVTVANMTQYNILQSTGMAALQQSNQAQQSVLKLLQ
ncbi:flagellin [Granulicella sp. 5B5]|uniref:flagellin n=1 Tax=Granulicella sp. 5B5 TaxID=1617967 RepID=UPI0015F635EC|nr:flagellin [Granulicella sp. 5B5]QMV17503.1 flagellin [Granulicella sp. 5B5]